MKALSKGKIILMILGLLLGAGAALGATLAFGESLGITKPAQTTIKYVEKPKVGMMLPMRERIVNLADPGVMRYLKVSITLEMADHSGKALPAGEKYKEAQNELKLELAGTLPLIEDELTAMLTARTSAELMAPEGKQRLRDEIKAKLNRAFEKQAHDPKERQEVLSVYFSDFIIQ
ncbi:MAG: flagellar basal body-associated FliL family protein [Chloroflexi bacterium]|nr:flagellar basal body-associated FliL family protein [Chloroflexota bacterium]